MSYVQEYKIYDNYYITIVHLLYNHCIFVFYLHGIYVRDSK